MLHWSLDAINVEKVLLNQGGKFVRIVNQKLSHFGGPTEEDFNVITSKFQRDRL